MCQAKPGPRCSSDTYAATLTSYKEYQDSSDKENSALTELAEAELALAHHIADSKTVECSKRVIEAKRNASLAKSRFKEISKTYCLNVASYYATPDGIKLLQHNISNNEGKHVLCREGDFDENRDWVEVKYYEDAAMQDKLLLSEAIEHRQWQSSTLAHLKALETTSDRARVLNTVIGERMKIKNKLATTQYKIQEMKQQYFVAFNEAVTSNESLGSLRKLATVKRELFVAEERKKFLTIQEQDLGSYEKNLLRNKKIPILL